jgi:hypothetical protein
LASIEQLETAAPKWKDPAWEFPRVINSGLARCHDLGEVITFMLTSKADGNYDRAIFYPNLFTAGSRGLDTQNVSYAHIAVLGVKIVLPQGTDRESTSLFTFSGRTPLNGNVILLTATLPITRIGEEKPKNEGAPAPPRHLWMLPCALNI